MVKKKGNFFTSIFYAIKSLGEIDCQMKCSENYASVSKIKKYHCRISIKTKNVSDLMGMTKLAI